MQPNNQQNYTFNLSSFWGQAIQDVNGFGVLDATVEIETTSLLPLGLVLDFGPSNDKCQAFALLEKSFAHRWSGRRPLLYADAGYDPDWIRELCQEEWKVESIIKPVRHKKDGTLGGTWRSAMTKEHLRQRA